MEQKPCCCNTCFCFRLLGTLEEIGMEAKEDFKKNGGNELHVIPCLNVREDWVNTLVNWIEYWHKPQN